MALAALPHIDTVAGLEGVEGGVAADRHRAAWHRGVFIDSGFALFENGTCAQKGDGDDEEKCGGFHDLQMGSGTGELNQARFQEDRDVFLNFDNSIMSWTSKKGLSRYFIQLCHRTNDPVMMTMKANPWRNRATGKRFAKKEPRMTPAAAIAAKASANVQRGGASPK